MECLLIADDLTGACDAAVHFAGAQVLIDREAQGSRVVAISTESRDLAPAEIRRAWAMAAGQFSAGLIFQKIDSTLRGNTAVEIAAAMEAFRCDEAVVCPAFPAQGRVVEGGWLRINGAPEFSPIDVAARIQVPCSDASSDDDLDGIVARNFGNGRRVLWVGSAGLASALARRIGNLRELKAVVRKGPALFCIGSDHARTLAQQAALLSERAAVQADSREAICAALSRGQHVVLRIRRGCGTVRELIGGAPAAALVLSGGDTASLVCAAAGVRRIELCDEIVPGVPRGILRGGEFDGIPVVTKSGGFGDRDTLIHVADFFACSNPK
uniref:Type III effector Hrp-dependent outers n=1 Tax=Solibacter usitatus (strain Ellin6076) TaxID=234267 RepID=Q02C15_SOLUE